PEHESGTRCWSRRPRPSINNPESAAPAKMDLFVDLKVPAVGGSQWTTAEHQREEKSLCGKDLQTLLDFCGSPQIDAVERAKGIEPSS
ncbi:hypothetical protein, partial [Pseudomonas aeruginosa]|uniref:hypothetical protein n=1 Tax=Pseudomonas aeruginosa TaxID=287 RepID=UPI001ABC8E9A